MNWMRTVLKSGTLPDKMAALTILIQDSPIHGLGSIDTLVNMAKKKGRREALLAIGQYLPCNSDDISYLYSTIYEKTSYIKMFIYICKYLYN